MNLTILKKNISTTHESFQWFPGWRQCMLPLLQLSTEQLPLLPRDRSTMSLDLQPRGPRALVPVHQREQHQQNLGERPRESHLDKRSGQKRKIGNKLVQIF